MKKILSLILIAGLVIVLIAGCGGKQEAPSGESESQGENESKVSTIKSVLHRSHTQKCLMW